MRQWQARVSRLRRRRLLPCAATTREGAWSYGRSSAYLAPSSPPMSSRLSRYLLADSAVHVRLPFIAPSSGGASAGSTAP